MTCAGEERESAAGTRGSGGLIGTEEPGCCLAPELTDGGVHLARVPGSQAEPALPGAGPRAERRHRDRRSWAALEELTARAGAAAGTRRPVGE